MNASKLRVIFCGFLLGLFSLLGQSYKSGPEEVKGERLNENSQLRSVSWIPQQKKKKGRQKAVTIRAKKPDFSKTKKETGRIYFDNVLKEGLAGPLPKLSRTEPDRLAGLSKSSDQKSDVEGGSGNGQPKETGPFSGLISAATVEGQVKRTVNQLSKIITTPRKFRTDYQKAHIAFTKLAVLFAVNEVMTKEVRWHSQAAKLRTSLAKTAASCRVGTSQAYQAAKQSLEDMRTVLSGSKASLPEVPEALSEWDTVADRGPLMAWLEDLHQNQLRPNVSSESLLKKNKDQVKESAELVAAISKILILPELDGYDDEDYRAHSLEMLEGAKDVVSGIDSTDFPSAIKGVNRIEKSCANCHEDYR